MQTHIIVNQRYRDLDPDTLFNNRGDRPPPEVKGRGKVVFFSLNGVTYVRKHYERGGWMRQVVRDRYVYSGFHRTRMTREFRLLESLREIGLPVPEPVAVRCLRPSPFTCSGDLVTVALPETTSLGAFLKQHPLPKADWGRIGSTIGSFHHHAVYHADLNIENILLGPDGAVSLLDFDKGRFLPLFRPFWIRKNLQRLKRSLRKTAAFSGTFHFTEEDWATLLTYHQQALPGNQISPR